MTLPDTVDVAGSTGSLARTRRQRQILDDLEAIFREEGFRRLTVGELANRLRCSKSTLYAIAPTKEELFLLVQDRLMRRTGAEGEARVRGAASAGDRLSAYLEGTVAYFAQVRTPFMDDVMSFAPARALYDDHQRAFVGRLRGLIEEGIASGDFAGVDPLLAATALDAVMSRVRDPEFLREHRLTASQAFDQVLRLVRHGLERS
ncbi:MAG: TetR/AcrR family transcriptional regulator [Myxococcota bacterium]